MGGHRFRSLEILGIILAEKGRPGGSIQPMKGKMGIPGSFYSLFTSAFLSQMGNLSLELFKKI